MARKHICTQWLKESGMFQQLELLTSNMKMNRVACMFCLGNYFIPK